MIRLNHSFNYNETLPEYIFLRIVLILLNMISVCATMFTKCPFINSSFTDKFFRSKFSEEIIFLNTFEKIGLYLENFTDSNKFKIINAG